MLPYVTTLPWRYARSHPGRGQTILIYIVIFLVQIQLSGLILKIGHDSPFYVHPSQRIPPLLIRHILSRTTFSYGTHHGLDSPVATHFVVHISDISGHSLTVPCGSPVSDRHHTPVCPSIPALTPPPPVRQANTGCPKTHQHTPQYYPTLFYFCVSVHHSIG